MLSKKAWGAGRQSAFARRIVTQTAGRQNAFETKKSNSNSLKRNTKPGTHETCLTMSSKNALCHSPQSATLLKCYTKYSKSDIGPLATLYWEFVWAIVSIRRCWYSLSKKYRLLLLSIFFIQHQSWNNEGKIRLWRSNSGTGGWKSIVRFETDTTVFKHYIVQFTLVGLTIKKLENSSKRRFFDGGYNVLHQNTIAQTNTQDIQF